MHDAQGSALTATVEPRSGVAVPAAALALSSTISACAEGSPLDTSRFDAMTATSPCGDTRTAPTAGSPRLAASAATPRARSRSCSGVGATHIACIVPAR